MKLKNFFKNIGTEVIATVFPELCSYCHKEIYSNSILCIDCIRKLPYTHFENTKDNAAEKLLWGRFEFEKAYSLFYMYKEGMMNELMHLLKYKERQDIGVWFGELMAMELQKANWINFVDAIIPIPLNKKKQHKRGYNQSQIIAEALAQKLKKEFLPNTIIRTINTSSQTKKNRLERMQNVDGIFEAVNIQDLKYKHILLLDDVITTGATIEACANLIKDIDGVKISVVSVGLAMR